MDYHPHHRSLSWGIVVDLTFWFQFGSGSGNGSDSWISKPARVGSSSLVEWSSVRLSCAQLVRGSVRERKEFCDPSPPYAFIFIFLLPYRESPRFAMHDFIAQRVPMPEESSFFYPFNSSLEEELKRLLGNFTIDTTAAIPPNVDDVMEDFRHNGQDYEYCPEPSDSKSLQIPRRKKNKKPLPKECVFCKNNGEMEAFYKDHVLRDSFGRIVCPVLRAYTCKICGANGDSAHTKNYCPKRGNNDQNLIATANAFKLLRNSTGKRRR